jgi:hypothetical protein
MSQECHDRVFDGRTISGFILAPLIGGPLFAALATWPTAIIIGIHSGQWSAVSSTLIAMIAMPFVGLIVMAPVMYLGMAVIGLPAMLLFHRMGLERCWTYGIWGTVWTVPLLFALWKTPPLWITPAGGLILILFWALARRGR